MARARLIAAIATAAVGCGGSGSSGPTIDELPSLLAERVCPELEACLGQRTVRSLFGAAGCTPRITAQGEDSTLPYTKKAVAAGRVLYDSSKVDACFNAFKGVGCGFASVRIFKQDACAQLFTGKVKVGDPCAVDEDCEGLAFCKQGVSCPGTCTALIKAGKTCDSDDECESGLTCATDGTCTAPAKAGEPCGGGVAADCDAGLVCASKSMQQNATGTCKTQSEVFVHKLGETCDVATANLCTEKLSCVVSVKNGMSSFACAEPVAADAACQFGVPGPCPATQYCSADISTGVTNGTCRPLPVAGEKCTGIGGSPDCEPGLECDTDQLCHPINRLGQPCVSDAGCASAHCESGKCQRQKECTL